MGASFLRAASKHALMVEDETQLTAGMAYPVRQKGEQRMELENINHDTQEAGSYASSKHSHFFVDK